MTLYDTLTLYDTFLSNPSFWVVQSNLSLFQRSKTFKTIVVEWFNLRPSFSYRYTHASLHKFIYGNIIHDRAELELYIVYSYDISSINFVVVLYCRQWHVSDTSVSQFLV